MIVKYLENDVWNYIGNVRHASSKHIDVATLARRYDDEVKKGEQGVPIEPQGITITEGVKIANKAFMMATSNIAEYGDQIHSYSALDPFMAEDNYPAAIIIMSLSEWREFDTEVLVTNQTAYLMNDKGQTIERLV